METKKTTNIQVPHVVADYLQNTIGAFMHNNTLKRYAIRIRGIKWWWPIFTRLLDNMMLNAWKMHCLVAASKRQDALSQYEFHVEVTNALLDTKQYWWINRISFSAVLKIYSILLIFNIFRVPVLMYLSRIVSAF